MPKKIKIEFWNGYPGGAPLLYDKDTMENIDKIMDEQRKKALDLIWETGADHVLYCIEHIGLMKRFCFYCQPMSDEEFHKTFAYQGKRVIHALHKGTVCTKEEYEKHIAALEKKKSENESNGSASDGTEADTQKSEGTGDPFWDLPKNDEPIVFEDQTEKVAGVSEDEKPDVCDADKPVKKARKGKDK